MSNFVIFKAHTWPIDDTSFLSVDPENVAYLVSFSGGTNIYLKRSVGNISVIITTDNILTVVSKLNGEFR